MSESLLRNPQSVPSAETVDETIALVERLRASSGGTIDEASIQAISEATGAPTDFVRMMVLRHVGQNRRNVIASVQAQYMTLEPDARKYVITGTLAAVTALLSVLSLVTGGIAAATGGLFGMLALLAFCGGLWGVAASRDSRVAASSGAVLGGGYALMFALFAALLKNDIQIQPFVLVPAIAAGAVVGIFANRLLENNRTKLGLRDPAQERRELLQQMVEIQAKLRSAEQRCTFVSVDIVGSTRMKEQADPLAVEYTFTEYHQYIERISRQYSGRIHSTAGDGVIAAFDDPCQAFAAARNMQSGLIELNTFRNKIGIPIALRIAIHTGVVAPTAGDITSVNFAHVIDVTAHLQKIAPPGGVAVSEATAAFLPGGFDSVGPESLETEGTAARVWQPRAIRPGLTKTSSVLPDAPETL